MSTNFKLKKNNY